MSSRPLPPPDDGPGRRPSPHTGDPRGGGPPAHRRGSEPRLVTPLGDQHDMTARLRRILVSALLGLLVGLGAVAALLTGRRPAGRGAAIAPRADATARAGTVLGPVAGTAPSTRPGGAPGARRAGRGRTAALVGLVLVAGLVAALSGVGGAFPGLPRPTGDGAAKPLAALSPPAASPPAASPLQTKAPSASEPLPDGGIGRRPDPRAQAPAGSAAPTG